MGWDYLRPDPFSNALPVTGKVLPPCEKLFLLLSGSKHPSAPTRPSRAQDFSTLHHFIALAQERGDVEIVLLEIRHDGAAHAVERNHVGGNVVGSVRYRRRGHVVDVGAIVRHAVFGDG